MRQAGHANKETQTELQDLTDSLTYSKLEQREANGERLRRNTWKGSTWKGR